MTINWRNPKLCFPDIHDLPELNQEDTKSFNNPIKDEEIETNENPSNKEKPRS